MAQNRVVVDHSPPAEVIHGNETFRFSVHAKDYISSVLANGRRFFEIEILEFVRVTFPQQKTIIDVGANIGNHAVYFAHYLSPSSLICFEPFPPNAELLRRNLSINSPITSTTVYELGLGDREREVGMRFHPENLGICRLDGAVPGNVIVKTLDSFAISDVTLLKIDVEGDDIEVLIGAKETIRKNRPIILIEGDFDKIFPVLAPFGYVCVNYWKPYQTYCFTRLLRGTID